VVNADSGPIAELLLRELEGEGLVLVPVEPADTDTGDNRIRTLILPSGLSDAVLAGHATNLTFEVEPDASADATLVARARIVKAIAAVLGRLAELRSVFPEDRLPGADEFLDLAPVVDLVQVSSRFAGEVRVAPGGFAQSIPGNTVMFVMLVALTYGAAAVSGDRSTGMLRRLATTPVGHSEIIAGKIAGRVVIAWLQIAVLMAVAGVARIFLGIDTGDHLLTAWVVLSVYAFSVAPIGVALGAWVTDPDRAASIGVIATMAMAALGGCWWPLEIVSKPLQTFALLMPSGWAMKALHETISFGRGLDGVAVPVAVLLGFGVVFTVVAAKSLRLE
jgi:ABC-type multidrug transport system permease subunit